MPYPKLKAGLPSSGFCGGRQLVEYPRSVRGFNVGRVKSVLQQSPSSAGEVRLWPAAVRSDPHGMNYTRFADSSRHAMSGGVRNTERGSFQSLVTILVAPRGAESSLNDEFARVERVALAARTIAR